MNIVDIIIILLVLSALVRGAEVGALRQVLATAGFFGGLFFGAWLEPHFAGLAHSAASRSWLALGITLGFALLLLAGGEYAGVVLKRKLMRHHEGEYADKSLGSVVGAATMLVTIWFAAAILVTLPFLALQNDLKDSAIVSLLDRKLPPAPNVIASLSHVIDPNGFPKVFNGNEPAPVNTNTPLPALGALNAAVTADQASVVKIEGQGCGGIVEGSGFVVAPGLVATNAHVVAGISQPYVFDKNGQHTATSIWFDPNLDFAVLSVHNLAGQPLALNSHIAADGTAAAVLGYPGGGDFTVKPAVVLDEFNATGRNIYDAGNTNRSVYEVKATVIPGNSGGPLITANGNVIGIVFAQSTAYNQVGYALTLTQVTSELHQAEQSHQPVSTGACAE
jgi:S1-C subfamily serine protease